MLHLFQFASQLRKGHDGMRNYDAHIIVWRVSILDTIDFFKIYIFISRPIAILIS